MANWNEDAQSFESNFPPLYEPMNDLDNPCEALDTSQNIQQPSNMISQNSDDEYANYVPLLIPNRTYISEFLMNENHENKYSSNTFVAKEPPKGTPDGNLSSNLYDGNSSPFPNIYSQTSFSNEPQNRTATDAFIHVDPCNKKDDSLLDSILEPWMNNGGGGANGGNNNYTTTFGNAMGNLSINSTLPDEKLDLLRNNKSYPYDVDSLSSLINGAIQRQSNPQEMRDVFSKKSPTLMPMGGTSSCYPSGINKSNGSRAFGEGNQFMSSTQASSLNYPNSTFLKYSKSNNYARSMMGQTKSSLSYPFASLGYSSSFTTAPQSLGARSTFGKTNSSLLSNPYSSFGCQNNWSRTSPFDAGTSSSLSEYSTPNLEPFPKPSAKVIHRDASLSKIRNGGISKGSKTLQMSHIAAYIRNDPYWWKKTDPYTQAIFDQIFEEYIRAENEKAKEKNTNPKNNKPSRGKGVRARKEAAIKPLPAGGKTQNASRGLVIKDGTQRANNFGTRKATTGTGDLKGKGLAADDTLSFDDSDDEEIF